MTQDILVAIGIESSHLQNSHCAKTYCTICSHESQHIICILDVS